MNHTDPVTKVTILPRGRALGYTMVHADRRQVLHARNEILDQLAYALGGRVAEEIIFHDPTTGAANDIEKATAMARKMVTEFGMSERVGAVKLGQAPARSSWAATWGTSATTPSRSPSVVDEEVRELVDDAHDEAWRAVNDNRDILDRLVLELLERETLNAAELARCSRHRQASGPADLALQRAPDPLRPRRRATNSLLRRAGPAADPDAAPLARVRARERGPSGRGPAPGARLRCELKNTFCLAKGRRAWVAHPGRRPRELRDAASSCRGGHRTPRAAVRGRATGRRT